MFIKNAILAVSITACLLTFPAAAFAHEKTEMRECMTMVHSSNADSDFMENMIPHHQMAIDMAKKELKDGKNDEARAMAKKIIADQQAEISKMQAWMKNNKKEGK